MNNQIDLVLNCFKNEFQSKVLPWIMYVVIAIVLMIIVIKIWRSKYRSDRKTGIVGNFIHLLLDGFRHDFKNELAVPIFIAVIVIAGCSLWETVYGADHVNYFTHVSVVIIFHVSTYMGLVLWRLNNESKAEPYHFETGTLQEYLNGSDSIFCTTIIPDVLPEFRDWFQPQRIIDNTSISNTANKGSCQACRVIVFSDEGIMARASSPGHLEAHYARRLASLHQRLGIDLAYMTWKDFNEYCEHESVKLNYSKDRKYLDFIHFGKSNPGDNCAVRVEKVRKPGIINPVLSIEMIKTTEQEKYDKLVEDIKKKIYAEDELDGKKILKKEYDFCKLVDPRACE